MASFDSTFGKWKTAKDIDEKLHTIGTREAVRAAHSELSSHPSVINARGQLESAENARRHDARQIPGSNG